MTEEATPRRMEGLRLKEQSARIAMINKRSYSNFQQWPMSRYQTAVLARSRLKPADVVAMRLRVGQTGFAEWLNEMHVYLLPNLEHKNILPYIGADKRLSLKDGVNFNSIELLGEQILTENNDNDNQKEDDLHVVIPTISGDNPTETATVIHHKPQPKDDDKKNINNNNNNNKKKVLRFGQSKRSELIEFWVVNDFSHCITLRHYLMMHTITWSQLIHIMKGILEGLNYLHEFSEFQDFDRKTMVDNYIRSTNGLLKRVLFRNQYRDCLTVTPKFAITIIHRNLSSLDIVLKGPSLVPCIWNFGLSYVHQPFQPVNVDYTVEKSIKRLHMSSCYSPPEVLQEKAYLTLTSMKSIDMYACGILCWELMSRCHLPKLESASKDEQRDRSEPDDYMEPFEREFGEKATPAKLYHAICRCRARPTIKEGWMAGKKTNKIVQMMHDLWDHDHEARIQTGTAISRLDRLSTRDRDKKYSYPHRKQRVFDLNTMWPPEPECSQAPLIPTHCESNIYFEEVSGGPLVVNSPSLHSSQEENIEEMARQSTGSSRAMSMLAVARLSIAHRANMFRIISAPS